MARRRAVFKTQGRKRVNGVVVAGSGYHHIATHDSAGFLSAPEFVIAPGFPRPICSSASGPWSRGPRFLFDLYTIYQHLQIHRIRRQRIEREKLVHLISENAAPIIAVVGLEGRRNFQQSLLSEDTGIFA